MSNTWHLTCKDCGDSYGDGANHGEECLANLWAERDAIIAYAAEKVPEIVSVEINDAVFGRRVRVEWLKAHREHDVRIVSEYGYELGECSVYFVCSECGGHRACRQKRPHEGGHERPEAALRRRALELAAHGLGNIVPPFEVLDGPEEQRELVAAAVPRLMALARAVRAALDGDLEKFEQNEEAVG
jgi:hypothetical protein